MTEFYTYLHCKPDGTPFYVGKGSGTRSHRLFDRRSAFHTSVVNKYGKENIRTFVFECESEEQAFSDEIRQIAQLRKEGHVLVNFTGGGEGGLSRYSHTEESKAKMSRAAKGKPKSLEARRRMSVSKTGIILPKFSEEHRAKLSEKAKNRSPEHREKLILAATGKKRSEETKRRIGEKSKGRKASEETRKKISASMMGKNRYERTPEMKERMKVAAKLRAENRKLALSAKDD